MSQIFMGLQAKDRDNVSRQGREREREREREKEGEKCLELSSKEIEPLSVLAPAVVPKWPRRERDWDVILQEAFVAVIKKFFH